MLHIDRLILQLPHYPHWWRQEWTTCIDALSLHIAPGEVHAVVGASGAGKSLLAAAIMGLLPSAARLEGALHFQATPLTPARQRQLRGRQLALIPQSLSALDPLARSRQQVRWAAQRAGLGRPAAQQRADELLAHYQLSHAATHYPHELSGGMARRVLIAMAQVSNAQLVIADEPSVGLDPTQRDRVLAKLKAIAREGKAVMLITHDLRHALPVADRVTVMYQGRGIETATAQAFRGQGEQLTSPYARSLWQALPDNAFSTQPSVLCQEPAFA
ncbi:ATP-binding cassette domain-containing protein [Vreelandella lutescens]|uniref:Nickel import system ATP-binding protein NikD n=1 Tax=Vreelandella lutescens TaxID=1602943 RepID=A0ABQ1NJU8_9GAMM|nr:ATP-binding cassette domain-containing protein [Halomonas lutescens]GGC78958.1 ATPase [Halomonas lutescens]